MLGTKFYRAFKKFRFEHGMANYLPDTNDCDDAATDFRRGVNICHKPDAPFAVGEIWFKQRRGGLHAINVANIDGEGWKFIEPQAFKIVELTGEEIGSICFVRF